MWLWIWILWPWPQLYKCQGSQFMFTEWIATAKLILMWLLPLQCHCRQKRCACVSIIPARGAVFGSPSSPLVTPAGTEENWSLYLSCPSRLLSAGWTSSCQPSTNLFATSSWFPQLGILLQQKLLNFVYQLLYFIPDFVKQFLQKSYLYKKDPKWTKSKTPAVLGLLCN